MSIEIKDLRCFVQIIKDGSISAAANSLFTTQSSISRKLREIESEIGTTLIKRTTRKIELTHAGEVFYDHAVKVLINYDEFRDEMKKIVKEGNSSLHIGYWTRGQFEEALKVVNRVKDQVSDFQYKLHHTETLNAIYKNEIDIGIAFEGEVKGNPDLEYTVLTRDGLSAFFANHPRFLQKKSLSLNQLKDEMIVLPTWRNASSFCTAQTLRDQIQNILLSHGFSENQFHTICSHEDFLSTIIANECVGIMPDTSAVIQNSIVASVPISDYRSEFATVAFWKKDRRKEYKIKNLRLVFY